MRNVPVNPDTYGVAAFRSRQQVLRFDQMLREKGIPSRVINTPRGVSKGCGVSVSFPTQYIDQAKQLQHTTHVNSLIGFYQGDGQNGRHAVRPV